MPALLRSGSFCQRQPDLKTRVSGFGIHLNVPAVLLHDSLHRVQAEPGSFADSLGREEGFEDVSFYLGRNPRTVIADFNHDATILAIGSNSKLALSANRVNG